MRSQTTCLRRRKEKCDGQPLTNFDRFYSTRFNKRREKTLWTLPDRRYKGETYKSSENQAFLDYIHWVLSCFLVFWHDYKVKNIILFCIIDANWYILVSLITLDRAYQGDELKASWSKQYWPESIFWNVKEQWIECLWFEK